MSWHIYNHDNVSSIFIFLFHIFWIIAVIQQTCKIIKIKIRAVHGMQRIEKLAGPKGKVVKLSSLR